MINCSLFKRKTIITMMFMKQLSVVVAYTVYLYYYPWIIHEIKSLYDQRTLTLFTRGYVSAQRESITDEATSCSRNAGAVGGPVWLFVSRPAADIVPRTSPRPRPANPSVLPEQPYSVISLSYGVTSTSMLYAFAFSNLLLFRESIVIVKKSKLRF